MIYKRQAWVSVSFLLPAHTWYSFVEGDTLPVQRSESAFDIFMKEWVVNTTKFLILRKILNHRSSGNPMQSILVVEDDKRVADLLKAGLEENGYQATVAYDGVMALRLFRANRFQLVISDIVLPRMDGLELCREIRKIHAGVPILMLTALGTTDDKLDGFDAGADDYMVKPFDFRELSARIRALLKRQQETTVAPRESLGCADLKIDLIRKEVQRGEVQLRLSPKEYKLLVYLVENAGRVISRTEIAEKVWETHFDTGTNFIDVYINYLRKKVDRDFEVKLIHTRPGMGFILTDKP